MEELKKIAGKLQGQDFLSVPGRVSIKEEIEEPPNSDGLAPWKVLRFIKNIA